MWCGGPKKAAHSRPEGRRDGREGGGREVGKERKEVEVGREGGREVGREGGGREEGKEREREM